MFQVRRLPEDLSRKRKTDPKSYRRGRRNPMQQANTFKISVFIALMALGLSERSAAAEKEVTFAYQDMVTPLRVLMDEGTIEKETGYKVN
jgi:hypothetical protein